jgi:hypothetical protein
MSGNCTLHLKDEVFSLLGYDVMSHLRGLKFPRRRKRMTGWVGAFSIRNAYRILADKFKGSRHLKGLNPVGEITIQ